MCFVFTGAPEERNPVNWPRRADETVAWAKDSNIIVGRGPELYHTDEGLSILRGYKGRSAVNGLGSAIHYSEGGL